MTFRTFQISHLGLTYPVSIDTALRPTVRDLRMALPEPLRSLPSNLYVLCLPDSIDSLPLGDSTSAVPIQLDFRASFSDAAQPSEKKRPRDQKFDAETKPAVVVPVRIPDVCFPLVYGNVARLLPNVAPGSNLTHKWTVYVRGVKNEDLSKIIEHVTFRLHHTFDVPEHRIDHAPFEVTQFGWGEFVIDIFIKFFGVPSSVHVQHNLQFSIRLTPEHCIPPAAFIKPAEQTPFALVPTPVVYDVLDEIVFVGASAETRRNIAHHLATMTTPSASKGVSVYDDIVRHGGTGKPYAATFSSTAAMPSVPAAEKELNRIKSALEGEIFRMERELVAYNCAHLKL